MAAILIFFFRDMKLINYWFCFDSDEVIVYDFGCCTSQEFVFELQVIFSFCPPNISNCHIYLLSMIILIYFVEPQWCF